MQKRNLKSLVVSAVGYGCMGLSHGYGAVPERAESLRLIRQAYDFGCTFFDTAEIYGAGDNELLVGEALEPIRDKVVIATKFHLFTVPEDSSRPGLLQAIENRLDASLKRLRTTFVDLYYWHRVNPAVPVEDVAWCLGELIRKGKTLSWGMSECTADEIRRAHAVTPLTAVQSEYSIMERKWEKDVIPTCEELGIGFVPFCPLASGFLSGKYTAETKYSGDDVRRVITRFSQENVTANAALLEFITRVGQQKGATPAQISLAWMLHKKAFIVPIPGSRTAARIEENLKSAAVELSDAEFAQKEAELAKIPIYGNRTDADIMKLRSLKPLD
jgi:aryl-alcohol dehydrogenase-like predicted oxidoreductase